MQSIIPEMNNNSQVIGQPAEAAMSYRMVNKSYHCYNCNKQYKKMMSVEDFQKNGIVCDHCQSDFCEAIQSRNDIQSFLGTNNANDSVNQSTHSSGSSSQMSSNDSSPRQNTNFRLNEPIQQRTANSRQQNQPRLQNVRVINPFESIFSGHLGLHPNSMQAGHGNIQQQRSQQTSSGSQQQTHFSRTTTIRQDGTGNPVIIHEYSQNGRVPAGGSFGLDGHGMPNIADLLGGSGLFMFRNGAQGAEEQQQRRVPEEVIEQLPVEQISEKHCKYDCNTGKTEIPTCSVCITDFEMGKEAIVLPCGHSFHPDCIKPWLRSNDKCPVCRKEVTNQQAAQNQ